MLHIDSRFGDTAEEITTRRLWAGVDLPKMLSIKGGARGDVIAGLAMVERKMRFELTTSSLARRRSTAELLPLLGAEEEI